MTNDSIAALNQVWRDAAKAFEQAQMRIDNMWSAHERKANDERPDA